MNNEFKKIKKQNSTHYVLETASVGATSASAVASAPTNLKMLKSRLEELKTKLSVPVKQKPRNPVGMGSTQGRGTQKHKQNQRQTARDEKKIYELEKPSGSMFLKFRGKRLPGDEMMVLGYGGFGTTPKDVTTNNALVKPFPADEPYDVIKKIESLFQDKDFVGVEKIILDIPNALSGQLRDVLNYIDQDPERFELFTGSDSEEPDSKTGGKVIGIGPDGKRIDRSPAKAQVGGSSRGIASTGMVTVQADSNGQRLVSGLVSQGKLSRDTKVQGNKITLRKDDYSKMMSVLGNAKFQQMFTKVGSVAESDQPDHEISMASSELTSIAKDAANLLDIVRQRSEEEGLEAWQQSKITKAADFMNSVLQSISGDDEQGVAEGPEQNKQWRDQARDASKEKRPWSPTNLPNYKKNKEQGVAEAGYESPHTKLAKLQAKYDQTLKSGKFNPDTLRKLRDQIIKLKFDLGLKEGVAEGLVGDVVVHNYTKMPIELKPGQAQIQGWGPNDQPIYRVKGHDGKEVTTSNKKKMMMIAQGQGVAEGSGDKTAQQRKTERDKQRTAPAQKARNQAQQKGLQQDKDGTYYAKEGVAEGLDDDLRSAVLVVLHDIYNGAQAGEEMIDTVADELGDYFQDVKRSKDTTLRQAYQLMRQEGGNAEEDPELMAQVAKQAIDMLSQQGVAEKHNDTFDKKSHQYKTTMKHADRPTVQQRMAAHDIKPGVKGYSDRAAMLRDLERTGKVKDMEEGLRDPKDNPCWKGYKPVGTKKKGGRTVPNCVPVKEDEYSNKLLSMLKTNIGK